MNPFWILLIGMVVVVGGVLALRLHAFLALVCGALVVAGLTPRGQVARYAAREAARATGLAVARQTGPSVSFTTGKVAPAPGTRLVVLRPTRDGYSRLVSLRVVTTDPQSTRAEPEAGGAPPEVRPDDLVIEAHQEPGIRKAAEQTIGERVAEGFGRTATEIGILIAMAAVVGQALLASGAAERIVLTARRLVGDARAGLAFLASAYVLGIPVFVDTVFYLLIPLAKVMRARSGRDYTLYVLCIVAGSTMTNALVPPTPGPSFVAAELHAGVAPMMLGGLTVSAIAAAAGYAYATWANRRWDAAAELAPEAPVAADDKPAADLPPLWLSLTPILLPVVLITLNAFAHGLADAPAMQLVQTLGQKNVALSLAAATGLAMAAGRRGMAGDRRQAVRSFVTEALSSAGVMVLIISAGGAFGYVLRQTDIAASLSERLPEARLALLPLAFLLTTLVRVSQGSATVSMIAAAGIVSPIAAGGAAALGYHPVYLAMAIGCGSKPGMWMNDSGFWIIGKMSGFSEGHTLRTATVMMTVMGVAGLVATVLGAWLLPLV